MLTSVNKCQQMLTNVDKFDKCEEVLITVSKLKQEWPIVKKR